MNNNGLQLSNVGLKFEEQLGYDFTAIGKLETQFNPIFGELGDACVSLLRYNGSRWTRIKIMTAAVVGKRLAMRLMAG